MRPRIARALVALVLTLISPAVASAAEDTFAFPFATSAPFDVAGSDNKAALKSRIIDLPPFDFPEPVASCRGCHIGDPEKPGGWFEPPPFTL